jgi:voltage-gated potassium channel
MEAHFPVGHRLRSFAERTEPAMFTLGGLFLLGMAILIVIWVDVPMLQERAQHLLDRDSVFVFEQVSPHRAWLQRVTVATMGLAWLAIASEALLHWLTRPWCKELRSYHWMSLVACLCPPLRMGLRSAEMNGRLWLPGLGWRRGGHSLQRRLERRLSVPMMIVALMIMPILITEFFLKDQVAAYRWLRLSLHVGTGLIWFAFAAEFILTFSVTDKKLRYCKQHWIDLAIILLPLISFLRTLRIMRVARLSKLMRVQQLTKLARAYRLRGTAIKAMRVLVLFDLTERILRISDERRIEKLERQLAETERQARFIRQKILRLKANGDSSDQDDDER